MSRPPDLPSATIPAHPPAPADVRQSGPAAPGDDPAPQPGLPTITAALRRAIRAPSIHNSQPWRWRQKDSGLELWADDSRWLVATDPDKTDLLLSCGAALHHARVAFAACGWSAIVHRVPDPSEPALMASLRFVPTAATSEMVALSNAITRRYSNRAPYSSWEVPDGIVKILCRAGSDHGAVVATVDAGTPQGELTRALAKAESARQANPDYTEELALWTGARAVPHTGVPEDSFAPPTHPFNRRPFRQPPGSEAPVPGDDEDASIFLVVGTVHQDVESRLRAGEAASAILLEATEIGLSTCPISLPVEVPGTRRLLRSAVFGDAAYPHLIVRVGWAHVHHQRPRPTPRLPLRSVFDPPGDRAVTRSTDTAAGSVPPHSKGER